MVISQRASQPVSHGSETSAEPCLRADQFEHLRELFLPNSTRCVPSARVMTMQGTLIAPYWSLSSGKCAAS